MAEKKDFSITKNDKGYWVYFHDGYITGSSVFNLTYSSSLWFHSEKAAKAFKEYLNKLTVCIEKQLVQLGLKYNANRITRMYLKTIDSISGGLDIRSDWSVEKVAEAIISYYVKEKTKALSFCTYLLAEVKRGEQKRYIENWKEYDKYKTLNELHSLGMEDLDGLLKTINDDLDNALNAANRLLEYLNKKPQ